MSLFWNPQAKKPQPWTWLLLVAIPIILFFVIFFYGKAKLAASPAEVTQDIDQQ